MLFLSWHRPSSKDQATCLARCKDGEFNYDTKFKGATRESPLSGDRAEELKKNGFAINHASVKLGSGKNAFLQGKEALQNWGHFQLPWASVDASTPIKEGSKFCVCANEIVTWVMNPLQVLYVDSKTPSSVDQKHQQAAFAYGSGTLHGHMLAGEEKFLVEWREDDSVWYEISSFAKPANFLSFAGYPVARLQQKMFAKQSMAAMQRAVTVSQAENQTPVNA
ncbi:hypothetical protein KC19_6G037200 [Ceratodon purpureus]|uniref:DUF1990 domain-containing protein n=1 Tax=Ceratodon purpureus TaxID=3225 RepID=A0A8T0HCM9_CERPU|nr:hypothetical protein KC19_6G037200 [Ceratodon purpureus]